jgi:hypothetical protein
MNIKVVDSEGNDIQKPEVTQEIETPPGLEQSGNILREQVAELFDLSHSELTSYKNKLDSIIEYAKGKTEDHSPQGIKWAVRSLGLKLGTPPLAEKLIEYIYRYTYLAKEGDRIDREKQRFLNGNKR